MRESATIAMSYVRSVAEEFGIQSEVFKTTDVHIHFPEGAVPKDGPSAGAAIVVALLSAFSGKPVRYDIAMTGEMTLRGKILPIGGLREKTFAAARAGIKDVLIPFENRVDMDEVDSEVKSKLHIHFISDFSQSPSLVFRSEEIVKDKSENDIPALMIASVGAQVPMQAKEVINEIQHK